jgi:uncharacterized protein with HEPN domain
MSKRSIVDWLGDIIAWGERLENHIAGMTYSDFIKDAKTQDPNAPSRSDWPQTN